MYACLFVYCSPSFTIVGIGTLKNMWNTDILCLDDFKLQTNQRLNDPAGGKFNQTRAKS